MIKLTRVVENPILLPSSKNDWEKKAAFNGSVIKENNKFHLLYRALSFSRPYHNFDMEVSSIGYAESLDGVHFTNNRQFIKPEFEWEVFGCEDPRVTKLNDKYFVFYTALSTYPFSAFGIRVGMAITYDFKTIEKKHLVTPFNAKAMALFPETINGKIAAVLTANTDMPPAKIAVAYFDKEEEIWLEDYWKKWYGHLNDHVIPMQRNNKDQVEVGAAPIKTKYGWLLLYSYIKNYFSEERVFGIEAVLLDLKNPQKILARTEDPLLIPEKDYEIYGNVGKVVFPSGALVNSDKLFVYYGASDTSCCLAMCSFADLVGELKIQSDMKLKRFEKNPILEPLQTHGWEAKAVFNPAAFYENGKIHLVYRAMSNDNVSRLGYAVTSDGFNIEERLNEPIYVPKEEFETNKKAGNFGCEDPRITKIGDRFYICYTAFDGINPPRVALTSIRVEDFLNRKWAFEKAKVISPAFVDDKDGCILPKKVNDKYMIFHRMESGICLDFADDLNFNNGKFLTSKILFKPRENKWDSRKIGICAPPIETKKGWLLLYHGISDDFYYRVGVALLDLNDPTKIIVRPDYPILEPEMKYEKEGQVANVVFPCGTVVIGEDLFVYYGGADAVVCVATVKMDKLLGSLTK